MPESRTALAAAVLDGPADLRAPSGEPLAARVDRRCEELAAGGLRAGQVQRVRPGRDGQELVDALACWRLDAVAWMSPGDATDPPARPVPTQAAVLQETSGSTGRGRLVARSADSLLVEAAGYAAGLDLRAGERVRVPVPVVHSFGWGVALAALLADCVVDARPLARPAGVTADVDSGACSVLALTPASASLLVETPRTGPARPRVLLIGAGVVSPGLAQAVRERFGVEATRGYGSTETGGTFLGETGIGSPVAGVEVVAPAPGATGELVLRLAAPPLGYVDDPHDPAALWRTGDVVERAGSGPFRFAARRSGPVRVNGRFVEVEPFVVAAKAVAGVDDVVVLVAPHPARPGVEVLTLVTEAPGADRGEVRRAVADLGGRHVVPRVRVVDRLPRTALGKVDRAALEQLVADDA